jgi:hypothetical protein
MKGNNNGNAIINGNLNNQLLTMTIFKNKIYNLHQRILTGGTNFQALQPKPKPTL